MVAPGKKEVNAQHRVRVSQADVPSFSLDQALRVAQAISESYAGSPTKPLSVAAALEISPNSSQFKMLTGASIAYGLTDGGYNAAEIALTDLGRRATRPLAEGDDFVALRTALLKPRILRDFLTKYDGSPLPTEKIALNVLQDMGVPQDRTDRTYQLVVDSAKRFKFTQEIKGKTYIDLSEVPSVAPPQSQTDVMEEGETDEENSEIPPGPPDIINQSRGRLNKKVFITHGNNKSFIEPIKKLLTFGEFEPIVSMEKQSVSQPVPDKVLGDMRQCTAAIIHVDQESKFIDSEANEVSVINPNVLIEIGAAMALYGRRFILLVREGTKLPSNLQGLYEVRYKGESMDGDATIKLLEAMRDIKNNPLPSFD